MATTTKKASSKKASSSTTSTAKKSTAARKATPRLRERQPQVIVKDTAFALAGVADEAVGFARELPVKLRADAPQKLRALRTEAPQRVSAAQGNLKATVHNQRSHYEAQLRELRERASTQADTRLKTFEKEFDKRATSGAKVVERLRKDERVARVEQQLGRVFEQSDNTRSQVKAAITSLRKTVGVALEAGRAQADTAKSQVKAAVTSARKTAATAADAGEQIAS